MRQPAALAALHEKGFLHGDIKPSNIGFTLEGSPKLLDFGLARSTDDAATAGGTLRHVSPEALSGRPAEEADDVWSLWVVLYETVSGRHPFAGVRRGAGRGPRDRLAEIFTPCLSDSFLPYVVIQIGKLNVVFCSKRTRSER